MNSQNCRFDVLGVLTMWSVCDRFVSQAEEDSMWWITVTAFALPETLILWLGIRSYRREHQS